MLLNLGCRAWIGVGRSMRPRGAYLQTVPRISDEVRGFDTAALTQLRLTLRKLHLTGGQVSY